MMYHLDMGQMWQCPGPWCSIWKGTTQDCIDHLRLRHRAGLSVKASTLGKCFLPWTVERMAWSAALRPTVSGITTDVMLFSHHRARLVHRCRVYGDYLPHHSLWGSFMSRLSTPNSGQIKLSKPPPPKNCSRSGGTASASMAIVED